MAQDTEDRPPQAGASLRLRLVLFASLAVNLLVIGAVAGVMLGYFGPGQGRDVAPTVIDLGLGPYYRALSPDDRKAVRETALANRGAFRGNRASMRRLFAESQDALRSDPFEPARIQAVLEEQGAIADSGRRLGQEILVQHLATMSPEARRAFADELSRTIRHRRHRAQEQRPRSASD